MLPSACFVLKDRRSRQNRVKTSVAHSATYFFFCFNHILRSSLSITNKQTHGNMECANQALFNGSQTY